jgi:iron complex outermembrane recepter protein
MEIRCNAYIFRWLFLFGCLSSVSRIFSQNLSGDSTKILQEVIVHGYSNDRPLSEVPAAIGIVDSKMLERFNNTSILPAINTIPGVRMEERSPGSYRIAIRGSSLRSPFGVRNVKIYWNGLPLTDGGGNTYINLLDFNAVNDAEIIKGPGGSLYGAGTGGVMSMNSPSKANNFVQASAMGGSFGLQRYQVNAQTGTENLKASVNYAHQVSNGYREHTALRRDALNTEVRGRIGNKSTLLATIFYTDIQYQTPGGLTQAQYQADPRQARSNAASLQAAVYNKTFYGGLVYDYSWNSHWTTRVGGYGSVTDFTNPTFLNYEIRKEDNWGGRTETQYRVEQADWKGKLTFGGEYQQFFSPLTDYVNVNGQPGAVMTDDRLNSRLALLFAQMEADLPRNFYLTGGASANFVHYTMNRVSVSPNILQTRNFDPALSPRLALLKKISDRFSLYASVSQGFSPPSIAEVRPSTGTFNSTLNPERGTSYETGGRGYIGNNFSFDITVYHFQLNQTIVIQHLVNGADYYVNAGSTSQNGLEAFLAWTPVSGKEGALNFLKIWSSATLTRYRFVHYVQNGVDYSGNKLTGVSPSIFVGGADVTLAKWFYVNVTLNDVGKIPLDDGNTSFSSAYFLAGLRLGYRTPLKSSGLLEVFGGVDNATNRTYSLGNDLNAAAGRYYNVAAGRNFYFGMKIKFQKRPGA